MQTIKALATMKH